MLLLTASYIGPNQLCPKHSCLIGISISKLWGRPWESHRPQLRGLACCFPASSTASRPCPLCCWKLSNISDLLSFRNRSILQFVLCNAPQHQINNTTSCTLLAWPSNSRLGPLHGTKLVLFSVYTNIWALPRLPRHHLALKPPFWSDLGTISETFPTQSRTELITPTPKSAHALISVFH